MLLIDLNQVFFAVLYSTKDELTEENIRHGVLNNIRSFVMQFKEYTDEVIICCDNSNYWRKTVFPYYKANRKKERDASDIDFTVVFPIFNTISNELKQYLPYKVLDVELAEADDIIATIIQQEADGKKKFMIVSADKDFIQLQYLPNVSLWNPLLKKNVIHDSPELYLFEHILKGDAGDGIPNIYSADSYFLTRSKNDRQKSVTTKNIKLLSQLTQEELFQYLEKEQIVEKYERNKVLIDFKMIPNMVKTNILDKYNNTNKATMTVFLEYLFEKRLQYLLQSISDFLTRN